MEDKLHAEVQENIRQRLKLTKSMPRSEEDYKEREKKGELKKFDQINPIAPNEAPCLITGVIELEKDVMQKKVGYIEHFMMMSEEEKQRRDNLRKGITPGEEKEEEEGGEAEEEVEGAAPKEVQIKGDTKLVIQGRRTRTATSSAPAPARP